MGKFRLNNPASRPKTYDNVFASIPLKWWYLIAIDRYILEGKELEFYMKKLQKKKGKAGAGGAA